MLHSSLAFHTTASPFPFQIDNDTIEQSIYAVMKIFVFIITASFIILSVREEGITGCIIAMFRKIKIQTHTFWNHRKKYKKLLKIISYITLASFIIYLEYNLTHRALIIITEHSTITQELQNELNTTTKNEKFSKLNSLRNELFLCISGIIISAPLAIVPFIKNIKSKLENHILRTFVATVIFGGFFSFFIPVLLYQNNFIGDTKDLTTALLGVTGGVVALFSLIKSHQKSELEREQLEVQKQKDSRDHIRQLYNSYSDRFDKAVTELNNNEDKNVAFAAVYKLSHLADDWLDFKDLTNTEKDFQKLKDKANAEVQTIINVFCKYIRSMPYEYTEEMLEKGDIPKEDAEIRRLIFSEISDRSSKFTVKNDKIPITPGVWSEFNFDFTRAPIFYPLNHLTIEKAIFSYARFFGKADFNKSTFIRAAAFNGVEFSQGANFNEVTFNGKADFSTQGKAKTTFGGDTTFNGVEFAQGANFNGVTFDEAADFSPQGDTKTTFGGDTTFNGVEFAQGANFNGVTFDEAADFSTQGDTKTTFGGKATFNGTYFAQKTNFNEVTFNGKADFSTQGDTKTTFGGKATFNGTYFAQKTNFNEVTFHEVTFNESTDLSIQDNPKTVFGGKAVFNDATFNRDAVFYGVLFKKAALFNSVLFCKNACFKYVIFKNISSFTIKDAGCRKTEFKESANFQSALFERKTSFKGAIFNGRANFYPNQLGLENTKFIRKADFSNAHFIKGAHFVDVKFGGDALFGFSKFYEDKTHEILNKPDEDLLPAERALIKNSMTHTAPEIYTGTANFVGTEFHGIADFMFAEFTGESIFASAEFYQKVLFAMSYIYEKIVFSGKFGSKDMPAHFSNKNNPDDYDFKSQKKDKNGNKLYIIKEDIIHYGDKDFYVPEGCKLFDPDEPKDLFWNYKQSESAKPIEESDNQGETPSE